MESTASLSSRALARDPAAGRALFGKTLIELQAVAAEIGLPRFAGAQMAAWLYKKGATDTAQMTNLSLAAREKLAALYNIGVHVPLHEEISRDGTRKYLFRAGDGAGFAATEGAAGDTVTVGRTGGAAGGKFVEAAWIPDGERATMCVSSQVGCRMGCAFCMTGRQGLSGNLTVGEILSQLRFEGLTNVVYMGMGEPLDNLPEVLKSIEILTADWGYAWSPSRVTVSTVGVAPMLKEFLDKTRVHLAVSLHNPRHDERAAIMPVEKAWPIRDIIELLRGYDFSGQRRVSFEYIVFKNINDTPAHVAELARLLNGLKARINLIKFHETPGSSWVSPPDEKMMWLRDALTKKGIITTIRTSRGEDIKAACGLLSTLAAPPPKAL